MPTTAINGLPSPDDESPNLPPIHFDALNALLDSRLVPRFPTTTARNNAYAAFVIAGGTLEAGMLCSVAGVVQQYSGVGTIWGPVRPRTVTRDHTPVAPGIPSGNFRESGVADGPSITGFTTYLAGTALVVATFRLGVAAVNTGYVTYQLKIDGVAVADGVARTTDESRMIHAAVALTAGSHTIALRAQAVGGDATWDSARVTIHEGVAE